MLEMSNLNTSSRKAVVMNRFLLFCLSLLSAPAWGESELQLHFGSSLSQPRISTSAENNSKYAIAAGLSVAIEFAPKTYLETGFHIRGHDYADSSTTEVSYTDMLIPIVGRYRLLPWFDLGAGFYYVQNPDSFKRRTPSAVNTVRFDSAGLESAEWGMRLNPRFYLGEKKHWYVDVSYDYGIKDLDKGGGATWRNRVYTFSLGYAFGLGGTPSDSDEGPEMTSEHPQIENAPKSKSKGTRTSPEYEGAPPI